MVIMYDNEIYQTRNLLIQADTMQFDVTRSNPAYKFIAEILKKDNDLNKPFDYLLGGYQIKSINTDDGPVFRIEKCAWQPAHLNNKLLCQMMWAKYDPSQYDTNEAIAQEILQLPFIASHLKNINIINWDTLFRIIEVLSENIKEELAEHPKTIMQCVKEGYSFQCGHIAALTAVCFQEIGVRSRICIGYPQNPISMCEEKPHHYFYESDRLGFGGMLHGWLEVCLEGCFYLVDPTPYFCSYQQWLNKNIKAPRKPFLEMIKRVATQTDFEHSPLYECLATRPLASNIVV